jgi:hypothetical protein
MFLLWDPIDCTQKIKESSGAAPADHLIATSQLKPRIRTRQNQSAHCGIPGDLAEF